jgi:hypothetical protein
MSATNTDSFVGRHFGIPIRFGKFAPGPLLRTMDSSLPPNTVVEFVSPIGRPLRQFLREHGRGVKDRLWQRHWELDHLGPGGVLNTLATFVEVNAITKLAVWFQVRDARGTLLLQMENGNDWIWLSDTLDDQVRERLPEAAGGCVWPTELRR